MERLIASVHRACPRSRLAVLTVFPRGVPDPATRATDRTIVAAARQADPAIIVFDPITGHWQFPRIGDHLHPTPAGHEVDRPPAGRRPARRASGVNPGSWLNTRPEPLG